MFQNGMVKTHRLHYIDALRGIAILGVILLHTGQGIVNLPPLLANFCSMGAYGVMLFFIVSALTLFMSINEREKSESYSTSSFYIRRLFRIAPLYYVGIIFYVLLDGFSARYWAPNGITFIDVIENFLFLHGWTPTSINSVVPGGWSIATEMCFYIFVPYIYKTVKSVKSALWMTLISLISSQILNKIVLIYFSSYYTESNNYLLSSFLYFWFPNQIPVFLLGVVLYFISQKNKLFTFNLKNSKLLSVLFITLSIFITLSVFLIYRFGHFQDIPANFIFGVAFVMLAYSLTLYSNPLFVNRFICFIGKISFSLYIWHFVVIRIVNYVRNEYLMKLNITPSLSLVIYFTSTLLISLLIGYISYRRIEIPGMKIGADFIKRIDNNNLKNQQIDLSASGLQ
jgi:peptidoglycan/LPS O-acetylase OafA/YrhL